MKKRLLSLILIFCMVISCVSCKNSNNGTEQTSGSEKLYSDKALYKIADEIYFNEISQSTLDLHFQAAHPENYGIEYFEPTFGTYYSIEDQKESLELCDYYVKELKKFKYDELSDKGELIYDILMSFLTSAKLLAEYDLYYEALSPTSGFQSTLPILLAEYQFYDKEDITDYIKLLNDMPRYFEAIAEHQRLKSKEGFFMSDITADQIIEQCEDFISDPKNNLLIECFDDKIDSFNVLSKDEITLLKEQNRDAVLNSVIKSYQILIDALTELKGTGKNDGGLSGYKNGVDYYELYVKIITGSDKSISEMKNALNNKMNDSIKQITELVIKDPDILNKIESFKFPSSQPEEIMEMLKTAITADFPLLQNAEYTIKYVHESLKEYLNPAMYLIPPVDAYNQNYIYINIDPEQENETMFSTVAHEGYPGHLYQNVYFLQTDPELIQTLIGPLGYSEGWGLYTEIYSYSLAGFEDNVVKAIQLNSEYIYCLYALADIGVHYEGWTLEEYLDFWAEQGIRDGSMADMYQYTVTSPGVYLPYVIGYLEILDMRNAAETALGNKYNVKEFHKFILEIGPAPFSIINERFIKWIKGQK